jgi:hypothetical protein
MAILKGLLEAGKLTPVVDSMYPLSEVSETTRYLEEGHAQGNGVIPCEWNPKEDSCSHSVGEDATDDHRSGSRGCVPRDALPGSMLWQPAHGQAANPTDRTGELGELLVLFRRVLPLVRYHTTRLLLGTDSVPVILR